MKQIIKKLKDSEGFVGTPYNDSLGIPTIGIGTKLPLSEEEAEILLKHRLSQKIEALLNVKPIVITLPQNKQEVLFEMAYQLGVGGLLKFKKMWKAIDQHEYGEAASEMLDSRWAVQTPRRANNLAKIMGS